MLLEAVGVFVLLKQIGQLLQVNAVKTLHVLTAGTQSLSHGDGSAH